MANYAFEFRTAFPGVEFQEIDVELPCPPATRALLRSSAGAGSILKIQLEHLDSDEEALARAMSVADHIASVLSFGVPNGHWNSWELDHWSKNADGHESLSQNLNLVEHVECVIGLGPQNRDAIRTLLAQRAYAGLTYYNQFRYAVGLSDALSRFMALYGIVLAIVGDKQEDVDATVLAIEPSVATNPPHRQRASRVPETVYTRLRNQIGHPRGVALDETVGEMKSHLGGLTAIARTLISRQLEEAPSIP
ncbi:MAG: hypothetical protein AB7G28_02420 [Pirellulales bacterium]